MDGGAQLDRLSLYTLDNLEGEPASVRKARFCARILLRPFPLPDPTSVFLTPTAFYSERRAEDDSVAGGPEDVVCGRRRFMRAGCVRSNDPDTGESIGRATIGDEDTDHVLVPTCTS